MLAIDMHFDFAAEEIGSVADIVRIGAGDFAPLAGIEALSEGALVADSVLAPAWLPDLDVEPTEVVADDQIAFPDAGMPDDWLVAEEIAGGAMLEELSGDATVLDGGVDDFHFVDGAHGDGATNAGEAAAAEVAVAAA